MLAECGIDLCHETVRFWRNRFGPIFATEIRPQRVSARRGFRHWRWHLDGVFVKINGETPYLWRAVDHEGEVLESYVTRICDKRAALRFMKKALRRHGSPETITTDGLKSYGAVLRELGAPGKQENEAEFKATRDITTHSWPEWSPQGGTLVHNRISQYEMGTYTREGVGFTPLVVHDYGDYPFYMLGNQGRQYGAGVNYLSAYAESYYSLV